MTPGHRIRELRHERGWTQRELAKRVGNIDHSGVSNIELGRAQLGRARAARFADALSVPLEAIYDPEDVTLDARLARIEEALMRIETQLAGQSESKT